MPQNSKMKYVIWGLGAVGLSFLSKIKENNLFQPDLYYCVEPEEKKKKIFLALGGLIDNFICDRITKDNHLSYLSKLNKGDFLLDFAIDIKNVDILKYCLEHDIHYLNTADSSWNPDPSWISDHQHYLDYVHLKSEFKDSKTTSIILFGMNPGLVSCFVKKAIKEIVDKDNGTYVKKNRKQLKQLIDEKAYSLVAKKLQITDIQEIDNDDQVLSIPFEGQTIYSTWNCWAFYYETISVPEIAFGNKDLFFKYDKIYDSDLSDLYLGLCRPSYEYETTTYSPQGMVVGHISTHEEVFTIRRYLSYGKYKPTVHFVYSPCDYALKSVIDLKLSKPLKWHLIQKNEIVSGGESVGVILQGNHFQTRYYGNYLRNDEIDEVATIAQVSAGAYAAFAYMLNHKNEGMLFPEELDEEEILKTAEKYLKKYLSLECAKIVMNLGRGE